MSECERLEREIDIADQINLFLAEKLEEQAKKRHELWMKLNRARRLEREELQNGKQ